MAKCKQCGKRAIDHTDPSIDHAMIWTDGSRMVREERNGERMKDEPTDNPKRETTKRETKPSGDWVSIDATDRWKDWQSFKRTKEQARERDPQGERERELKIELAEARLADLRSRTSERRTKRETKDIEAELEALQAIDRDRLERFHGSLYRAFVVGFGIVMGFCLFGIVGFAILIVIGIVASLF